MNYRIIILLTILFIITYNIKIKDHTKDKFSITDSLYLKGIFCLMVLISHLASWTSNEIIFSFSRNYGFFAVAGFLFISGYGLTKNIDRNNIKNLKQIIAIIIPYILINIIYYFLLNKLGQNISFIETIKSLINFHPIAYFSWYVVEIIIFYILFFTTTKKFKNPKIIILFMLTEIILYNIITYHFEFTYSWWLSNYAFILGMILAFEFKTINKIITNYYKLILCCTLTMFLLLLDYQFLLYKGFSTSHNIIISQLCITLFPLLIYLIFQKIEIKGKIIKFIGKYSYEIYLVQGIPLLLFRSKFTYIESTSLYTILCILVSILVGYYFHQINKYILVKIKIKQSTKTTS